LWNAGSTPAPDFLSIVSDALNIPLSERNVLLLAVGVRPSVEQIDAEQIAVVTRAIDRVKGQSQIDRGSLSEESHAARQISIGGTFSDRGQPYKGPRGIYVPSIFRKRFCP